jgi:hypothetical protein
MELTSNGVSLLQIILSWKCIRRLFIYMQRFFPKNVFSVIPMLCFSLTAETYKPKADEELVTNLLVLVPAEKKVST